MFSHSNKDKGTMIVLTEANSVILRVLENKSTLIFNAPWTLFTWYYNTLAIFFIPAEVHEQFWFLLMSKSKIKMRKNQ